MTPHQINSVWDWIVVGTVWVLGFSYKLIAHSFQWLMSLAFGIDLSISLVEFNEVLHSVVLIFAATLSAVKLYPVVKGWVKKPKTKVVVKRTRKK